MTEPFTKDWSLLGSNLWLRPVRSGDLKRVEAFLARRDLMRSGGADARNLARLLPWDSDPEAALKKGKALIATDAFGAPAGFFAVHTGLGDGPLELSFAVPKDAAEAFREGVRLVIDGLGIHTTLTSLLLRVEPHDLDEVLKDCGWKREEDGVWTHRLREATEEVPHAG
jgi:hypothetical protein